MNIDSDPRELPLAYRLQSVIYAHGFGLVTVLGMGQVFKVISGSFVKSKALAFLLVIIGVIGVRWSYNKMDSMRRFVYTKTISIKQIGTVRGGYSEVKYEDAAGNVYEKRFGRSDYVKHHPDHVLYDPENPKRMYLGADMLCLKIDPNGEMKATVWAYAAMSFVGFGVLAPVLDFLSSR